MKLEIINMFDLIPILVCDAKILDKSSLNVHEPAVDVQVPAFSPSLLDEGGLTHVESWVLTLSSVSFLRNSSSDEQQSSSFLLSRAMSLIFCSQLSIRHLKFLLLDAVIPPHLVCPMTMICSTLRCSTANCSTDIQLRSENITWLPMFL